MSEHSSPFFQPPSLEELAALLPAYEMMDFLAQGGMGAVYLARQISLDRLVAIKVLPPSFAGEKGYAQRFQSEAKAMAKLRHNHIVGVYDFGITTDGHLYLVMEYVEGQTLHDMIRLRRLPVAKVQGIALQLCEAIQYAHEHGILHRDIKPGNAMVDKNGQVKVMDFGLARRVEAAVEEESFGTPEYTAPEILISGSLIDHRADIYALGIVFQQMLTGKVPRQPRESLTEHGNFDPGWEPLISKAAATNAGARYQSMRELRDAVAHVGRPMGRSPARRGLPGGQAAHQPAYQPDPPAKSGTPLLPIVISVVVIGIGAFWFLRNRDGLDLGGKPQNATSGSPAGTNGSTGASPAGGAGPAGSASPAPAPGGAATPQSTPYQLPGDLPVGHIFKFEDGHKDTVNDMALFPDQRRVATASTDGTIIIWDLASAKRVQTLGPVPGALLKLAISHDGKYLAAGGDNYKAHLWNLDDRLSEPTKSLELKVRTVTNVEFSNDDAIVLLGTMDIQQPLVAWSWEKDSEEIIPGFRGQVIGLQMLPGSEDGFVAGGSRRDQDRWVYDLWFGHVSRRSLVKEYPTPPQGALRLRIAPDGKTILSVAGGRFQVWDIESGTRISRQQGGQLNCLRFEFIDGGRLIMGGGQDRALHIFETVTGNEVWKSEVQDTRCANSFVVSPDGKLLVSAGGFGTGNPIEKDGDYALHMWKLPDLSTLQSADAGAALARREMMSLESADPELWAMLGVFHQEWQDAAARSTESGRKDLDEKYLAALRREVATTSPSEKEHFLSEISRVANNGPTPTQRPASWPATLGRLFEIYVQQLELLPKLAQEARMAQVAAHRAKLTALEQQRAASNNVAGAERVRLVMKALDALGGEPDRTRIRDSLGGVVSPGNTGVSTPSMAGQSTSPPPAPATSPLPTLGFNAPPMTGASVLRRPARSGRVLVWKRSARTDEDASLQWPDTAPQISDAVSLSAGVSHVLVLRSNGTVTALGKKGVNPAVVPNGLDRVVAVAAGNRFDIALREDGSTVVWNPSGIVSSEGVKPAVGVHAGPAWGYARHADGSITRLPVGKIGSADAYSEPPPGLSTVSDIAIGTEACLVLSPDGTLSSWGSANRAGGMASIPAGKESGVIAITANGWDAAVLRRDGELTVWGAYPNSPPSYSPTQFSGADRIIRALPHGAFVVHFPGDRWVVCNSAGGQTIDASTAELTANGCFDLAVTSGYCIGIKP